AFRIEQIGAVLEREMQAGGRFSRKQTEIEPRGLPLALERLDGQPCHFPRRNRKVMQRNKQRPQRGLAIGALHTQYVDDTFERNGLVRKCTRDRRPDTTYSVRESRIAAQPGP